jgi:hypothetical protein
MTPRRCMINGSAGVIGLDDAYTNDRLTVLKTIFPSRNQGPC